MRRGPLGKKRLYSQIVLNSGGHGGGEAISRGWAGVQDDQMEPAQVTAEVASGDAAAGAEEILEPGMPVVDGLDVQFAAGSFAGRLVDRLVGDAQGSGTRWIAGTTIAHQQGILVEHRRQDRVDGACS